MTAINEHLGKAFSTKPKISINNDVYDYCKSNGTVNIISTGDSQKTSFTNYLGDICIVEATDIPESQITIPVVPSLIALKYVLEKAREDFKFKLKVEDPKTGAIFQIDEAYFDIPSNINLDSGSAMTVTVKGSKLYFL